MVRGLPLPPGPFSHLGEGFRERESRRGGAPTRPAKMVVSIFLC